MIIHKTCGFAHTIIEHKYFPLQATCSIVSDEMGKPLSLNPHKVTQIFRRYGDKAVLPKLMCTKCGGWFDWTEFTFSIVCTSCHESPAYYFLSEKCPKHRLREVCINCAAKHCLNNCKKWCRGFVYFEESYHTKLIRLAKGEE